MKVGCIRLSMPSSFDTTDAELPVIRNAVQNSAMATGVDHRFILASMMEESMDCTRVYITKTGNGSPGVVQNHAGNATCNSGKQGTPASVLNRCPYYRSTARYKLATVAQLLATD